LEILEHGSGKKFELKLNICEKSKKYSVGEVLAHGFRLMKKPRSGSVAQLVNLALSADDTRDKPP
jgi:hypothetical protein